MEENRSISGVNLGRLWNQERLIRGELTQLIALFEQKKIAPHVDKVFPLSAGAEAHRYVQERKNVGKVLFDSAASAFRRSTSGQPLSQTTKIVTPSLFRRSSKSRRLAVTTVAPCLRAVSAIRQSF